jgi:hypothetical protein
VLDVADRRMYENKTSSAALSPGERKADESPAILPT